MAVFRIERSNNYSVISNYHFKEKNMSLKAKGLLSEMLSLREDWDYSSRGLAAINKETKNTINSILQELEKFGYLTRLPIKNENGKINDWEYTIYEMPISQVQENVVEEQFAPCTKNEDMENEDMENWDNNKILNNKILNNKLKEKNIKKEKINSSGESVRGHLTGESNKFIKPNISEIADYIKEYTNQIFEYNKTKPKSEHKRLPTFSAEQFYDYYESNGWLIGKHHMKNWKATVRNWSRNDFRSKNNQRQEELPDWFNKDLKNEPMSEEDIAELDSLLDSINRNVESIRG